MGCHVSCRNVLPAQEQIALEAAKIVDITLCLCLIWIQADAELLTVTWSIWIRIHLFYIEIWIRSYIYDNDQRYRLEGQADTDDQNILKYERVWGG